MNQRSTNRSASVSQRASRSPSGSSANSSTTSGFDSRSRSHWAGISDLARGAVRSAAGASKSRSRTACTRVPLVAASLGFSGSLSITRNRYSSGHCMKSLAREGDSEAGARATAAAGTPSAGTPPSVAAAASSGTAPSVLVSMTTDLTARH